MYLDGVTKQVWLGQAANRETGETYASIDLYYFSDCRPAILKLVEEMQRNGDTPQLFIEQERDRSYVAVLFKVHPVSRETIHELCPENDDDTRIQQKLTEGKLEVVFLGEAAFRSNTELEPFLEAYKQDREFRLHITDGEDLNSKPAWGVKLNKIEERWPGVL